MRARTVGVAPRPEWPPSGISYVRIRSDTLRPVNIVQQTQVFSDWLDGLADKIAQALIGQRIAAAEAGNFGDCEPVGDGVSEMRIHFGPGYRVYLMRDGYVVYLLLCGGDKSTQKADIVRAKEMAATVKAERAEAAAAKKAATKAPASGVSGKGKGKGRKG